MSDGKTREYYKGVTRRSKSVVVNLTSQDHEAVHALAKVKGISVSQLVRDWIKEKLRET